MFSRKSRRFAESRGQAQRLDFTIRRATKRDIPKLVELAEVLLPGEASRTKRFRILARSMEYPSYDILVATAGRAIAGLVDLWSLPDFAEGSNISIIQNLVVAPRFRGRGIADALVKSVVKLAKKRRAKEIHVSTTMRNKKAIALYRKNGFTKLHAFLEKSPV